MNKWTAVKQVMKKWEKVAICCHGIFQLAGGLPVFWVPASELRTLYKHYSSYATADAMNWVRFIVKFDTSPWRLSEHKEIKKEKGLQTLTSTTTKVKDMIPSELVSKAHWSLAVEHSQEFSKLIASILVAPLRHDLDTLDSGRLVLRQMKPAVCCLRVDMQTCNVKMCCFPFSTTGMKEADCKAARSKHNFCILKPISIAQWGIGMIPLPKRCRDMTAIRVRLQMSTRQRLCEELRTYFARCEWMKKWQVSSWLCTEKRYPWTLVSWSYHDLWRYAWNVSLHQLGVVKPFHHITVCDSTSLHASGSFQGQWWFNRSKSRAQLQVHPPAGFPFQVDTCWYVLKRFFWNSRPRLKLGMQSRFEHDFFLVRRNAFGQTNWSQPFVKPVHADEDVEVDAEPAAVCNLPMRWKLICRCFLDIMERMNVPHKIFTKHVVQEVCIS